jgi:hypothetical protein
MKLAVVMSAGAAVLSLGPHLAIDGHLTGIALPAYILSKLPELMNILPARIAFELDAGIAAVLAFGIDDIWRTRGDEATAHRRTTRNPNIALVVVTVVLLVTQLPAWPYAAQPVPAIPAAVLHTLPQGDPIAITYPYPTPDDSDAMAWQAQDHFAFRLLGGYFLHPGPGGLASMWPDRMEPGGLQQFLAAGTPPSMLGPPPAIGLHLVRATRAALARYDVRLVLVDRSVANSRSVITLFRRALGRPQFSADHFVVWASRSGPL